jgi:hypothetical protein
MKKLEEIKEGEIYQMKLTGEKVMILCIDDFTYGTGAIQIRRENLETKTVKYFELEEYKDTILPDENFKELA